jgi:hypothetical protein
MAGEVLLFQSSHTSSHEMPDKPGLTGKPDPEIRRKQIIRSPTNKLPMTIRSFLLSMAAIPALTLPAVQAAVIYQHSFSGTNGTNLGGLALDSASGIAGGSAGSTWNSSSRIKADGSIMSPSDQTSLSAYVPFSPVNGYLYTISVDTTATAVALNPTTTLAYTGIALFNGTPNTDAAVGGQPVIAPITRSPDDTRNASGGAGPFQILRRWHRDNPSSNGGPTIIANHIGTFEPAFDNNGTWRLTIQLDTTNAGNWTYRWLVEDVGTNTMLSEGTWASVGSLGSNPISNIQLHSHGPLASSSFDNFLVTAEVPEPGATLLGVLSISLTALRRRKR